MGTLRSELPVFEPGARERSSSRREEQPRPVQGSRAQKSPLMPASWNGTSIPLNAGSSLFRSEVVCEEEAKRKLLSVSEMYEELMKIHREHAAAQKRSAQATLNSLKVEAHALSGGADHSTGREGEEPVRARFLSIVITQV